MNKLRIPKDYFITSGVGESNNCIHAGSYHKALFDAGIEKYNIMTYSSILPACATMINIRPDTIEYGSVMECIMSVAHSDLVGKLLCVGMMYEWLYDKHDNKVVGIVAEVSEICELKDYNINNLEILVNSKLEHSINELYYNGFSNLNRKNDTFKLIKSHQSNSYYASLLISLCFINYV